MGRKILIIGGVAGGATAAARARRTDESADITILERGPHVSFANCGLPYFVSGDIKKRSKLILQTPEGFDTRYGVKVHLNTEAVSIDRSAKTVTARGPGGESVHPYDKLILAQGGNPITPQLPGVDSKNVFRLWTIPDMDRITSWIESEKPKTAVVAGGGFIGLEMAEAFTARGIATTVVELMPRVMSIMDPEFGGIIERTLAANKVGVITGKGLKVVHFESREAELSDGSRIPADLVLLSIGVKPELTLAKAAGLEIGVSGGLVVDGRMATSDPDIYAAGDMVETRHAVTLKSVRIPLAGPANRQGRIAASNALGMDMEYAGALGTSVVKIFDMTAAMTGLTEKAAKDAGFDAGAATVVKEHHASYYPGGKELSLKLVYDRKTGRILGAQAAGGEGVEKRIDTIAVALHGKMTLRDLSEIDFAYAPPYSTANDPVNVAAFAGLNDVTGFSPLETVSELKAVLERAPAGSPDGTFVLDVRNLNEFESGHIKGSVNVPVDDLRYSLENIPRDRRIHLHCRSGLRAHVAQRILRGNGFADTVNLSGGFMTLEALGGVETE